MLIDTKKVITPAILAFPKFIEEDGIRKKISGYLKTDDGIVPIYEETSEISEDEALSILLGGDGE